MRYALFVPTTLLMAIRRKDGLKLLNDLPLAVLEGERSLRSDLALGAKNASVKLNIQIIRSEAYKISSRFLC